MKETLVESPRFRVFIITLIVSIFARISTALGFDIHPELAAGVSTAIAILSVSLIIATSYRNTDPYGNHEPYFESQRVRLALVVFVAALISLFLPLVAPEIPVDVLVEIIYSITGMSAFYIAGRTIRNTPNE